MFCARVAMSCSRALKSSRDLPRFCSSSLICSHTTLTGYVCSLLHSREVEVLKRRSFKPPSSQKYTTVWAQL